MCKEGELRLHISNPEDLFLIKFGKKEHLERIQNGIIRFTKISFYRNTEAKDKRKCDAISDENEGLNMLLMNKDKPVSEPGVNSIKVFQDVLSNKYVFCLSCFMAKEINKTKIGKIIKGFPEYDFVLFFQQGLNFINNVLKSINQYNPQFDRIRYYDFSKSLIGLDEFVKCNSYAYQNECRFSMDFSGQNSKGITKIDENIIEVTFEKVPCIIAPVDDFCKELSEVC